MLNTRVAASAKGRPVAVAARALRRTKFCSGGSSAAAARRTARSSRVNWLGSRSRKMPEQVRTTSMRGRPNSARGTRRTSATRPRASR